MGSIVALLTGIGPILAQLLKAHEQAAASADHQAMAMIQARVDALKGAYALAQTAAGQIIVAAFAFPVWVYICKIIIWDKVLGFYTHGTTDPINGAVEIWVGMIMAFIFGHGLVSRIYR